LESSVDERAWHDDVVGKVSDDFFAEYLDINTGEHPRRSVCVSLTDALPEDPCV